ncbi:hypothetical protein DPMN_017374 [Dreissena polymorpha]|uniref:IPT/TIG domain-containing protein n=1 Tax=Dreissena polymorpha TaxID=45954 RepID=A0A9D4NF37_DREPO|nr:hypothetical protein DPMN_017374 [Dreissena polymorpha]
MMARAAPEENPSIKDIYLKHGFLSGGTILTVTGDNLVNAQLPKVFLRGNETSEPCLPKVNSTKILFCKVPAAPTGVTNHLNSATCPGCLE